VIDVLPESAAAYGEGWAVVAVDVMRATTTAVTIASTGRRCLPVSSEAEAHEVAARLENPLLVGEWGGDLPESFDLQNSPAAMEARDDVERPAVLLSTSGTRLIRGAASADAVYVACLRNVSAQVAHLAEHHPRVAVIGAGTKGEFRREDQFGCARIAEGLLDAGYGAGNGGTAEIVERWRNEPVDACAGGRSAEYLRRTRQLEDLEFVLTRIDDVDGVFRFTDGELRQVSG
jgi:2-phosphosulfolactate phosphatase